MNVRPGMRTRATLTAGAWLLAAMPTAIAVEPPSAIVDLGIETGFHDVFTGHHNRGRACVAADFDNDGVADFFVGNPGDPSFTLRAVRTDDGVRYEFGERLLAAPELAWGGAAADYDNDGDTDLFVSVGANEGVGFDRLFENQWIVDGEETGEFRFVDVTEAAGLQGPAMLTPGEPTPVASANAVWGDYDLDGWVDLFVSVNIAVPYLDFGPEYADKGRNVLWHNNGDGTFTDVTVEVGLDLTKMRTRHSAWLDIDNDGDLDLYENNFGDPQVLWRNLLKENGEPGFEVSTGAASLPGESLSEPENSFASAVADVNGDGWTDILAYVRLPADCNDPRPPEVGGQGFEGDSPSGEWEVAHVLLINLGGIGRSAFMNVSEAAGLADKPLPLRNGVMGAQLGDFSGDGVPDIFVGNGGAGSGLENDLYVSTGTTRVNVPGGGQIVVPTYADLSHMIDYPSTDDGSFGFEFAPYPYRTHGTCLVDSNGDGHLEMAVINGGPSFYPDTVREPNRLFQAEWEDGEPHRLVVHLVGNGTTVNKDGIGARLQLRVREGATKTWSLHKTLFGGSGFSGQNGLDVHFGLADADTILGLEVTWPDGTVQQVGNLEVDTRVTVVQPD